MDVLSTEITAYIEQHTTQENELLNKLYKETYLKVPQPNMISGMLQGRLLSLLSKMMNPKAILEIGTYTGYATICLAQGLSAEGKIVTIDINEELQEMVGRYVREAGLESKFVQHIGHAVDIIPQLDMVFDIVFIDADKKNYSNYYDLCFDKVRPGGIILADNVFWDLKVIDERVKDINTESLRAFSRKIQADPRVENTILPVRDGLSLIRKK